MKKGNTELSTHNLRTVVVVWPDRQINYITNALLFQHTQHSNGFGSIVLNVYNYNIPTTTPAEVEANISKSSVNAEAFRPMFTWQDLSPTRSKCRQRLKQKNLKEEYQLRARAFHTSNIIQQQVLKDCQKSESCQFSEIVELFQINIQHSKARTAVSHLSLTIQKYTTKIPHAT